MRNKLTYSDFKSNQMWCCLCNLQYNRRRTRLSCIPPSALSRLVGDVSLNCWLAAAGGRRGAGGATRVVCRGVARGADAAHSASQPVYDSPPHLLNYWNAHAMLQNRCTLREADTSATARPASLVRLLPVYQPSIRELPNATPCAIFAARSCGPPRALGRRCGPLRLCSVPTQVPIISEYVRRFILRTIYK